MKEGKKIMLTEIMEALQQEEQYARPEVAFRIGWEGWRDNCLRHGKRTPAFFSVKWNDGWLTRADAQDLCNYLRTGWNPDFLEI